MLYTRKGDSGTSGLFGTTKRLPKNDPILEALGTLDELNSLLGICRAHADPDMQREIQRVQETLFIIQAELAGSELSVREEHIETLERTIDRIESAVGNPHAFVIPGTTIASGYLDFARAVARRAERCVVAAHPGRSISAESRAYLNRLSSFLYALARDAAAREGRKEVSPIYT